MKIFSAEKNQKKIMNTLYTSLFIFIFNKMMINFLDIFFNRIPVKTIPYLILSTNIVEHISIFIFLKFFIDFLYNALYKEKG